MSLIQQKACSVLGLRKECRDGFRVQGLGAWAAERMHGRASLTKEGAHGDGTGGGKRGEEKGDERGDERGDVRVE
jgi:hypothetical protein